MSTEPTLAISRFKATCLAVLEDVRRTGRSVTVTRLGKPVARVVPLEPAPKKRRLGGYKGRIEIVGDIVSPILPTEAWEVLRK